MRCLILVDNLGSDGGGTARSSAELAAALGKRGLQVSLASARFGGDNAYLSDAQEVGVSLIQGVSDENYLENLIESSDVVIASGTQLAIGDAMATFCDARRIPFVFSARGSLDPSNLAFFSGAERTRWQRISQRLLQEAHAIHVTSKHEKQGMPTVQTGAKWISIPNAMDLGFLKQTPVPALARETLNLSNQTQHWLSFGRIVGVKNLQLLVRLLAKPQGQSAHLHLVGAPDPAEVSALRRLADTLGVSGRIGFQGPVQNEERALWLQAADVHLFPSQSENFCRSLVEAIATGAPILCSPHVGALEYGPFRNVQVCDLDLPVWQKALDALPDRLAPQFDVLERQFNETAATDKWIGLLQSVPRRR